MSILLKNIVNCSKHFNKLTLYKFGLGFNQPNPLTKGIFRSYSVPKLNSKLSKKIQKTDRVPLEYYIIYRNPSEKYIISANLISSVVCVLCGICMYMVPNYEREPDSFGPENSTQFYVACATLIATCLLLQFVTRKVPLRIYNQGDTYIMSRYKTFGPLQSMKLVTFTRSEVSKVNEGILSKLGDMVFNIKGSNYLIFDHYFRINSDYNKFIGSK